jgi:soluble lytic murein transglycosylase-like protein
VDPALALALIEQESGFQHPVRGRAGELGAAQILPATAGIYGLDRRRLANDFVYNVQAGLWILKQLLEQVGDEAEALRAYNGGRGWRSLPDEAQRAVRRYANQVLERRARYGRIGCAQAVRMH